MCVETAVREPGAFHHIGYAHAMKAIAAHRTGRGLNDTIMGKGLTPGGCCLHGNHYKLKI
jgi:hypothetical protein